MISNSLYQISKKNFYTWQIVLYRHAQSLNLNMKLSRFLIDCSVKLVATDKNISIWGKTYNLYLCIIFFLFFCKTALPKNPSIYCALLNLIDLTNWYCVFSTLHLSKKIWLTSYHVNLDLLIMYITICYKINISVEK